MEIKIKSKTGDFVAIIDDEDFEKVSQYKWHMSSGYAKTRPFINGKYVAMQMAHIILGCVPNGRSYVIDHINRNKLDNRKSNIRKCSWSQNTRNRASKSGSYSKYIGVSLIKKSNGRIVPVARLSVNNKDIHLGCFKTEEEAAKAYDNAVIKYCGHTINLNFPNP